MQAYILKRLLAFIPTVIMVSMIAFILLRLVPGDPAVAVLLGPTGDADFTEEELIAVRAEMGTDRPLHTQYLTWVGGMLRGDMGKSLMYNQTVADAIKRRVSLTAELGIGAILVGIIFALPLGIISALKQNTWIDYVCRALAITGVTIPLFVMAILIVFLLVVVFEWKPALGFAQIWQDPWTNFQQIIFPIIALSVTRIGYLARITRSAMLDVLREDYVRTARAKGLKEQLVIIRHALKNAMLPVLTLTGLQFAVLLGGTVIIEAIFLLPGTGSLLLEALFNRDYTMVQGVVMMMTGAILLINLTVDLMYGWFDPRIRYG
jgi:peptide/nickel transport system permease protein